ncbi:hypothetical protein GEMRC1_006409 [Eukaryota sp. GEM-RC1]
MISDIQRSALLFQMQQFGFEPYQIHQAWAQDPNAATVDQLLAIIEAQQKAADASSAALPQYPYNEPVKSGEDEQIQQAIQASLQTHQEREQLQSNVEIDLQKAIETSLKQTSDDPNPLNRKKKHGVPVGLKNVGNTCYLSSILQTLYYVPCVRKILIEYNPPSGYQDHKNSTAIKVVLELQRLFAYLTLSERSYFVPTDLVAALVAASNVYSGFEALTPHVQHDATEFFIRLLDLLEIALGHEGVTKCFKGSSVDLVECTSPTNPQVKLSKKSEPFVFITVPLTSDDLESVLDSRIDPLPLESYDVPPGHSHPTLRSLVDHYGESAVCMAIQRYDYNRETQSVLKKSDHLRFPFKLMGDRWKFCNLELIDSIHHKQNMLKSELELLRGQEQALGHFGESQAPLPSILRDALNFLRNSSQFVHSIDTFSSECDRLLPYVTAVEEELDNRRKKVSQAEQELSLLYKPVEGEPLFLFSVLIHQGTSLSGHYWNYVASPVAREESSGAPIFEYFKFNDQHVSLADVDSLMSESFGGSTSHGSAYFLVYIKEEALDHFLINTTFHCTFKMKYSKIMNF